MMMATNPPSKQAADHVVVDGLTFGLVLSARRRTIDLAIERDGSLVVRAPADATHQRVTEFIRTHQEWLYKKLAEKEALSHTSVTKEYVTGEGFPYLGRSYRLLLVEPTGPSQPALRLDSGRFKLRRDQASDGRKHFIRWYTLHGQAWIRRRVSQLAPRMGVSPTSVTLRDLGYRWGSCGTSGSLNFHWASILLPPSIVEYIIVHELAHLTHRNHTPEFWATVERALPDYLRRKAWLAERGGEVVGGM